MSKNLSVVLLKPPRDILDNETGVIIRAPDKSTWTDIQTINYEMFERFKKNEYEIFKQLHSVVLNDNGNPTIKKTAFSLPGYRRVLR